MTICESGDQFLAVFMSEKMISGWWLSPTPLKNMKVRLDHHPNYGENKKCSKPPMRYWTTEPSNFRGNSTCPKRCQTLKTSAPKRMVTATAQLVSLFHPINCLVKWQDFPYEKLPQDIKA